MFRWKKSQPDNGTKDGSTPAGATEPKDSVDTSDISAPPLKPFTAKGSHTPAKPPTAPSFQPAPARRTPPNIPGVTSRISERATSTGHDSKRLVIGRDISLQGEITSCDRLLVEGRAEIDLPNTHQLEVTPSGFFRGSAEVEVADISGQFEGDLIARDQLIVRAGGRLSGTVRYGHIIIEAGGQVSGDMQSLDGAPDADPGKPTEAVQSKKPKPKAAKP
ncbi:MAG: polymer-forming cytoskeletal protein [Rhodospirillales bacterium]|nr:polymer-forming cytoskeletal protein [Rhodospirillales bacterium]